jgi:hypothetical protein
MRFPKTLIFFTFAILLLPIFVFAQTPGIPHKFYGTVSFTSGNTPDGLLVEAKIKITNVVVGNSATKDGKYGYTPNLLFATDSENTNSGKTVEFYVSGIKANQTATFVNGESTNLNLTVSGTTGMIEETDENKTIENKTTVVAPTQTANIKLGNSLNITVSSGTNTNATINKIEKLTSSFFTGSAAIIAGNNLLNAFEINITGDNLTISVTISYNDAGIDEDTIKPYKFDGTSWAVITSYTLNKSANTITFNVSSAQTPYAVFGQLPTPSGGGGGATTPTPTPTPISAQAQKVDTNKDNKIDILDFNSLMVSWGSTIAGTIADFNADNKVDIFDFNLLMIYWTG